MKRRKSSLSDGREQTTINFPCQEQKPRAEGKNDNGRPLFFSRELLDERKKYVFFTLKKSKHNKKLYTRGGGEKKNGRFMELC